MLTNPPSHQALHPQQKANPIVPEKNPAATTAHQNRIDQTLALAKDHADPNFCLSVPTVTKTVLANLLTIIDAQRTEIIQSKALSDAISSISASAASCRRTAGDPDQDPDSYNAGFADATIGAASKLEAALEK